MSKFAEVILIGTAFLCACWAIAAMIATVILAMEYPKLWLPVTAIAAGLLAWAIMYRPEKGGPQ